MRPIRILALAAASALAILADAPAQVLLPPGPITAVTVHPDGAEVTRTITLDAPFGAGTVGLEGLTANLDPASLRVETVAGDVGIASVDVERVFSVEANQRAARDLISRIEALEAERAELQDDIRAAERQLELVGALIDDAGAGPESEAPPPTAEHWREMLTLVGEASAEAYDRQRRARREITRIEEELQKAQNDLAQLRGRRSDSYTVSIALDSADEQPVELSLVYRVAGAAWRPLYDARVDTEAGDLELVQLAEVTQTTGEDWDDVRLSLSTTQPRAAGPLPELQTWFIDLQPSVSEDRLLRRELEERATAGLLSDEAEAPPAPAPEPKVALDAGEFSATYIVAGRVSIAADGTAKTVRLDVHELDVALGAKVAPGFAPVAHLVGELVWEAEAPLLPGEMSVYRDGAFVGRQYVGLLRPGETRELTFGADDRIAVEHRLASGERGSSGLIRTKHSEARLYRTEITNHHARPLEITVLDRLPVSRHEDISVEMLSETTPPTDEDVEEHEGVLAWRHTYEPEETRVIRFGYVVRFPEDGNLMNF